MTLAAVKEKLHSYIEHADDKKVKAMFTLVENDIEPDYEFSDADMEELNRRRDNYLSGKSKSIPLEESKKNLDRYIANKKKNAI
jgi:hypothetical protein